MRDGVLMHQYHLLHPRKKKKDNQMLGWNNRACHSFCKNISSLTDSTCSTNKLQYRQTLCLVIYLTMKGVLLNWVHVGQKNNQVRTILCVSLVHLEHLLFRSINLQCAVKSMKGDVSWDSCMNYSHKLPPTISSRTVFFFSIFFRPAGGNFFLLLFWIPAQVIGL